MRGEPFHKVFQTTLVYVTVFRRGVIMTGKIPWFFSIFPPLFTGLLQIGIQFGLRPAMNFLNSHLFANSRMAALVYMTTRNGITCAKISQYSLSWARCSKNQTTTHKVSIAVTNQISHVRNLLVSCIVLTAGSEKGHEKKPASHHCNPVDSFWDFDALRQLCIGQQEAENGEQREKVPRRVHFISLNAVRVNPAT